MRWRGYECKDTGFPIKNVGNDRGEEMHASTPGQMRLMPLPPLDPSLQRRGKDAMPLTPEKGRGSCGMEILDE